METKIKGNARIHVERAIEKIKNTHYLVKLSTVTRSYFFTYGVCMRLSSKSPETYC